MSNPLATGLEKVWDSVSQIPYAASAVGTAWDGWKSWSIDLGGRLDQPWQLVMIASVVVAIGAWRIVREYVWNAVLGVLALAVLGLLGLLAYGGFLWVDGLFEAHPVAAPFTAALIIAMVVLLAFVVFHEPGIREMWPILFGLLFSVIFLFAAIGAAFAAHPVIMSVATLVISTASLAVAVWLVHEDYSSDGDWDLDWIPGVLFVVGIPAGLIAAAVALLVWGVVAAYGWVAGLFARDDEEDTETATHELEEESGDVDHDSSPGDADQAGEVATLHQMFKAPSVIRPDDDPAS